MPDTEDWWFKTRLANRYKFAELRPYNNPPYGEELWSLVWRLTETQAESPLRDTEMKDIARQRLTGYIVSRLLAEAYRIRTGFPHGPLSDTMEHWLTKLLDEMIERMLDTSEVEKNQISDLLSNITRRVALRHGEPSDSQKNAIATFAETNGHRCYLCAAPLNYSDFAENLSQHLPLEEQEELKQKHNKRRYELEHIYPASKGGSRSPYNLSACCNECNKFKANMTTFAELPIETMLVSSDKSDRVRETFGKRQRFGLFWRQHGRCKSCERPFFQL
ncbi:hypothetical protein E4V01_03580, partial [Methylorubrum sp. Q1]|uniref:HNH endonuclease n=1 Tax=Methylorubrum sp. Q1 TaxID=2562453 RepID=UPI00110504FB